VRLCYTVGRAGCIPPPHRRRLSRSIHTTRRRIETLRQTDFADGAQKRECIGQARTLLYRKRRIKAQVWRERHTPAVPALIQGAPVAPDAIPIIVQDVGEFWHYPAGEADLRAVMRLLPPGALDGLHRTVLCAGSEYQRERIEADGGAPYEPDPYTGRVGSEDLPGVYSGPVLGTYSDDATIRLYAYVYDAAAMPDRAVRELYLRLRMLSTFLHEAAHHYDAMRRVAGGRWLAEPGDKCEEYAERNEHSWAVRYAVPYLEAAYPEAARAFREWTERHGGVAIPLALVAQTAHQAMCNAGAAYEELATCVTEGSSPRECRLEFAQDLRLAMCFAEALASVEAVLAEHPGDLEALTQKVYVLERLERYDEAEQVARDVLRSDPTHDDAWDVLARICRARHQWGELEAVVTSMTASCLLGGYQWARTLLDRARARLEMGELTGAEADLEALRVFDRRYIASQALELRAILLLRRGRYEDALRLARRLISAIDPAPHEDKSPRLAAIRFEAAHALGPPREAGSLTQEDMERLRRLGHGAWMDRLVEAYGLAPAKAGRRVRQRGD